MFLKAEENCLGWYVKYFIETLTVAVRISITVPKENSTQPKEFKKQYNKERLSNWREKAMHGQYVWKWLRKGNLFIYLFFIYS